MRGTPSKLKVNLDGIRNSDVANPFFTDGVRVGSLHVSSNGLSSPTTSLGSYTGLTFHDLIVTPEREDQLLGKGSSGSVWKAVNRRTGQTVALKEIRLTNSSRQNEIRRELESLYTPGVPVGSSYVVDFYGAFYHDGAVFIAMECLHGSLDRLPYPLPLEIVACVARSVLRGLEYLHTQRHLIHRDIKPNNVLFNRVTGELKISDFGISSCLESTGDNAHTFVGTVTYMSPERLKGEEYSFSADVWSFGLLIAEMVIGMKPFAHLQARGTSAEAKFWSLLQHLSSEEPAIVLPDDMDAKAADFLTSCLMKAPARRPTCTELLSHPFLEGGGECEDQETIRIFLKGLPLDTASASSSRGQPGSNNEVMMSSGASSLACKSNKSAQAGGEGEESSSAASTLSLDDELQRLVRNSLWMV